MADHLIADLQSPSIPLPTCTALHGDLTRLIEDKPVEPPDSKRAKLDPTFSVPVHAQVAVCNAVRAVVDGRPVQTPFWKLFLSSEVDPTLYVDFLFRVSCTAHNFNNNHCVCSYMQGCIQKGGALGFPPELGQTICIKTLLLPYTFNSSPQKISCIQP